MAIINKQYGVYIVGLRGSAKFCKIGVTSNIKSRLKQISTHSPHKPYLYHLYKADSEVDAYRLESKSHTVLEEHRANGEWFKVVPEQAYMKLREIFGSQFPKQTFFIEPINLPKSMDGLVEHTARRRKADAAKEKVVCQ